MRRLPYLGLAGVTTLMALWVTITCIAVGRGLHDPDSFLGPEWVQFPALVIVAFLADVVPRGWWRARKDRVPFREGAREVIREHWTRARVALVVGGLACFFVTYVSYRNLKSLLPFVRPERYDYTLHRIDLFLMFGHDPALVLQRLLGSDITAQILALAYMAFLPMVPLTIAAWAVWSRRTRYGWWYLTADCICWALGTLSYYAVPSLGPAFAWPWKYGVLAHTSVTALQDQLSYVRENLIHDSPHATGVQSLAAFASLHVAITLMNCLMVRYTVRIPWLERTMWVYLFLVVISTTYFGWHYIADDLAGVGIAWVAVYGGGYLCGYRFPRAVFLERPSKVLVGAS